MSLPINTEIKGTTHGNDMAIGVSCLATLDQSETGIVHVYQHVGMGTENIVVVHACTCITIYLYIHVVYTFCIIILIANKASQLMGKVFQNTSSIDSKYISCNIIVQ